MSRVFPKVPLLRFHRSEVLALIRSSLAEDRYSGDVTSHALLRPALEVQGVIISKAPGIISGLEVVKLMFKNLIRGVKFHALCEDGEIVRNGKTVATLRGNARGMLSAERSMLNILQRMSGIATQTSLFVKKLRGTSAQILDTRKTAPGLRILDKIAVQDGGGRNHRMNLAEMYLIKENHIAAAGGIDRAVERARRRNGNRLPIEIEVRTVDEFRQALRQKVDVIMLDNMGTGAMRTAVRECRGRKLLEASGNISLKRVRSVAQTGVDFISVGSLTNSAKALDLSFLVVSSV